MHLRGITMGDPSGCSGNMCDFTVSKTRESEHNAQQRRLASGTLLLLTSEEATYGSLSPSRPFDLARGTWGAFQIGARYGALHVDKAAFPLFANPTSAARVAESWGSASTGT